MVSSTSENATSFWPVLEQRTLRAFMEVGAADSPGVVDSIDRAVRYVKIDDDGQQIVLDSRAFVLGLLSSGRQDTPSAHYGNTATWTASFVAERFRDLDSALSRSLTGTDSIINAAKRRYSVVVSSTLANDVNRARRIARSTVNRNSADLRHIVSAHFVTDRQALEFFRPAGWTAGLTDVAELRAELYRRLENTHEPEENLRAWWSILRPDDQLPGTPPIPAPPPTIEISGFASDRPTARLTDDPLDLSADVMAFARLICLQDIDPPLSIGLFGGWGSGKSTFMHRLEATVEDVTRSARAKPSETATAPSGPAFIRNAVQIRFNAWHFADANLWASLTAEFFDQLRAGGYARSGKTIHARLVERVNNHVHQLTAEAKATRDAVVESEENVRQALNERDEAAAKATLEVGKAISQTLVDSVVNAYETHKADLKELGGKNTPRDISTFIALAKDLQSTVGQIKTLAKFVFASKWRGWLALAGFAAVSVASYVTFNMADVTGFTTINIVAFLGGAGALARSILPGIRLIANITRSVSVFAEDLDKKLETQLKAVAEKEDALRKATAESEARRAASERASKALSRYVDPGASGANLPRLLRYMLEDNPDTQALEKEIGLISRVRRLFQAVNEIVAEEKGKEEGERDQDVPDRIIIYIDDLDRCSPPQVYAVLQAIHLLLAFELFVVVVGVDVTWVEEALAHELRPALRGLHMTREENEQAEREARKLATRYMEKIFQLPFWVRRLSSEGPGGGSYASYVRGMLQRNLETEGDLQLDPAEPHRTTSNGIKESVRSGASAFRDTTDQVDPAAQGAQNDLHVSLDDDGLGEALATVKLTAAEVEFLASEAIGRLAGREPRTVKRFINIYRIIRARLDAAQRAAFLGSQGRPAVYPIVAILVATETGQGLETAQSLHRLLENHAGPLPSERLEAPLQPAWAAAQSQRNGAEIIASECRPWSLLVQRYSFNRYD